MKSLTTVNIRILIQALLSAMLVIFVGGCNNEDTTQQQLTYIINYLESQTELSGGRYGEYFEQGGVYRLVPRDSRMREGYNEDVVSEMGDRMRFWYDLRTFSSSGPGSGTLWTNKPSRISELQAQGLNPEHWPKQVEDVTLGVTKLMTGLSRGLPGARQRDSTLIIIPSELAYGDERYGTLPKDQPLVFIVTVEEVIKPE